MYIYIYIYIYMYVCVYVRVFSLYLFICQLLADFVVSHIVVCILLFLLKPQTASLDVDFQARKWSRGAHKKETEFHKPRLLKPSTVTAKEYARFLCALLELEPSPGSRFNSL